MGGHRPETSYRFPLPLLRRADACLWHVPNPPKDGAYAAKMPGALSFSRGTASCALAVRKRLRNSIRTDVLERESPNGPLWRLNHCFPRALRLPACRRWRASIGTPFAKLKEKRIDGLATPAKCPINTGRLEGCNNKITVAKTKCVWVQERQILFTLIRYLSLPTYDLASPKCVRNQVIA